MTRWQGQGYSLPCLNDNARSNTMWPGNNYNDPRWFPISTEAGTFFVDTYQHKPRGSEGQYLLFEVTGFVPEAPAGSILRLDVEKLSPPLMSEDTGKAEIWLGQENGGPSIAHQNNNFPTFYLALKIALFAGEIAAEVVVQHPELEAGERYAEKNSFNESECPFGRLDSLWLRRADLSATTGGLGELEIMGDLRVGVLRAVSKLIRSRELGVNEPRVFDDFSIFWEKQEKSCYSGRCIMGFTSTSSEANMKYVAQWWPDALGMLNDPSICFDTAQIRTYAQDAWEIALKREKRSRQVMLRRKNTPQESMDDAVKRLGL